RVSGLHRDARRPQFLGRRRPRPPVERAVRGRAPPDEAGSMTEFLRPGRYIDSAHPAVVGFSGENAPGSTERERAVSLYYAVRDKVRYKPFLDFSDTEVFKESSVLAVEQGFCVGKPELIAACVRDAAIRAR